jgi:hypothetical protein
MFDALGSAVITEGVTRKVRKGAIRNKNLSPTGSRSGRGLKLQKLFYAEIFLRVGAASP